MMGKGRFIIGIQFLIGMFVGFFFALSKNLFVGLLLFWLSVLGFVLLIEGFEFKDKLRGQDYDNRRR